MKDDVDTLDRFRARVPIADVALDHREPFACTGDEARDLVEVALVTRREIVEADHVLPRGQKRFDQV